ncbi:hypothetical protein GOA55_10465 [Sinorhizobium meliloti]|nr:hypothetical protein [Sinorhizobium meliloti]
METMPLASSEAVISETFPKACGPSIVRSPARGPTGRGISLIAAIMTSKGDLVQRNCIRSRSSISRSRWWLSNQSRRSPSRCRRSGISGDEAIPTWRSATSGRVRAMSAHTSMCDASGAGTKQWALLFRDYMRAHVEEHAPYVALKRALAERYRNDRAAYTDGKKDHLWAVIRRANGWAADVGWLPPPSDA